MPAYAFQTRAAASSLTGAWAARERIQQAYRRGAGPWPALAKRNAGARVAGAGGELAAGGAIAFIVVGMLALAALGEAERSLK